MRFRCLNTFTKLIDGNYWLFQSLYSFEDLCLVVWRLLCGSGRLLCGCLKNFIWLFQGIYLVAEMRLFNSLKTFILLYESVSFVIWKSLFELFEGLYLVLEMSLIGYWNVFMSLFKILYLEFSWKPLLVCWKVFICWFEGLVRLIEGICVVDRRIFFGCTYRSLFGCSRSFIWSTKGLYLFVWKPLLGSLKTFVCLHAWRPLFTDHKVLNNVHDDPYCLIRCKFTIQPYCMVGRKELLHLRLRMEISCQLIVEIRGVVFGLNKVNATPQLLKEEYTSIINKEFKYRLRKRQ